MKWADQFHRAAQACDIECVIVNRVNGWPETMSVAGHICFTKSVTYNSSRSLYFQGVDPKKLKKRGDYVLLCGGFGKDFRDIFIIPWRLFFRTLARGEPVNTYKPPKEYWQYKFQLKDDRSEWTMHVQGGERPQIDVSGFRYNLQSAIEFFLSKQGT